MIEIYSGTALLLLVNPCLLHRNNRTARPTYIFIVYTLLPAMFNPLCSSTNQQLFKRTFVIKVATMKITDDFHNKWKPTTKSTLFVVNKDEWDTKEGRGKSMKNALYVQQYGKRYLSG